FVALLGWSPADNQEIMTLSELEKAFDYTHIGKSPAVLDTSKLRWMNGEYIKKMDDEAYLEKAKPFIMQVIDDESKVPAVGAMVKSRIEVFPDILPLIDFLKEVPEYGCDMYKHKKMKTDEAISLQVLKDVMPVIEAAPDFTNDALYQLLLAFASEKGLKNGQVMWPIRTALSGKAMTPGGATQLLEVLGKEESLKRVAAAIEKLTAEAS
ncbi:MAG: glutamate--tRNA ligase, partial [Lachnospiraceae bacterium]|nr:glutamate--tRNA ligase [Candidatus Equihabitans merdae]